MSDKRQVKTFRSFTVESEIAEEIYDLKSTMPGHNGRTTYSDVLRTMLDTYRETVMNAVSETASDASANSSRNTD
jgi:hypothetical protein